MKRMSAGPKIYKQHEILQFWLTHFVSNNNISIDKTTNSDYVYLLSIKTQTVISPVVDPDVSGRSEVHFHLTDMVHNQHVRITPL